jgi:hypothetical protein
VVRVDSAAADRFDTSRFDASRNRLASLAYRPLGAVCLRDGEVAAFGSCYAFMAIDSEPHLPAASPN